MSVYPHTKPLHAAKFSGSFSVLKMLIAVEGGLLVRDGLESS